MNKELCNYQTGFISGCGYSSAVIFSLNLMKWWKPDTYSNIAGIFIGVFLIIFSIKLYKKTNDTQVSGDEQ